MTAVIRCIGAALILMAVYCLYGYATQYGWFAEQEAEGLGGKYIAGMAAGYWLGQFALASTFDPNRSHA